MRVFSCLYWLISFESKRIEGTLAYGAQIMTNTTETNTKKYSYRGDLESQDGDTLSIKGTVKSPQELFEKLKAFSDYEVTELELKQIG